MSDCASQPSQGLVDLPLDRQKQPSTSTNTKQRKNAKAVMRETKEKADVRQIEYPTFEKVGYFENKAAVKQQKKEKDRKEMHPDVKMHMDLTNKKRRLAK